MKSFFVGLFFLISTLYSEAQVWNPGIGDAIGDVHEAVNFLKQFETFGKKVPGSQELQNTSDWLFNYYSDLGYEVIRDSFIATSHQQMNIIAKKQGLTDDFIILCGHYDTRNGPGVNDNGTGVSATMYAAKVLKNLPSERTVYFINFSGEEDGLYGSGSFVNTTLLKFPGTLKLVINLDQLGGTLEQPDNDKIYCERDEIQSPSTNNLESARVTDTITHLAQIYSDLTPVVSYAYSSDYIPFETKGYVITGLFQYSQFPFRHTEHDSFSRVDTISFMEAVKISTSSAIHFAKIPKFIGIKEVESQIKCRYDAGLLEFYGIPSDNYSYAVVDQTGKEIQHGKTTGTEPLNILKLTPGIYWVMLNSTQSNSMYYCKFLMY